ncbi:MAG: hypothetical protein NTX85_02405 [Candidatus Nomurabacteria bacterium]|nr:hypothetical protein [Candidatus Nomurabacteria bacterium]
MKIFKKVKDAINTVNFDKMEKRISSAIKNPPTFKTKNKRAK